MAYTVKQLADLAKLSVRTLHYYDEIELLKPTFIGDNNYRYYDDEALLKLQQIMFYKKLGFSLLDIQKIVSDKNFDTVEALRSHQAILEKNLNQTKQLIQTIEKTINHLRGVKKMKLEEIFEGFDAEKQAMYENFLIEQGFNEKEIQSVMEKIEAWNQDDWIQNKKEHDDLYVQLAQVIDLHLKPSSKEAQSLIKNHYLLTKKIWTPDRVSYIGLSKLYSAHPDFVAFYNAIHPKLLHFMQDAMQIFADRELK